MTIELQRVNEQGWRRGFANLLSRESSEWWLSRRWLVRTILWAAVISGITAAVLSSPDQSNIGPGSDGVVDRPTAALLTFVLVGGLITCVGVIISMQSAVLDEKKYGTAAWVLSKPVARSAFILSKVVSHGAELLLRMVVIPSIVVFILLTVKDGASPALLPYVGGVCLLGLHLLFYLSLTVMLGTVFEERGLVIGLPLLLLLGAQLLLGIVPLLDQIMPWSLIVPSRQELSLGLLAMLGQPLPTIVPILATIIWIVIFVTVAIIRFEREEF